MGYEESKAEMEGETRRGCFAGYRVVCHYVQLMLRLRGLSHKSGNAS